MVNISKYVGITSGMLDLGLGLSLPTIPDQGGGSVGFRGKSALITDPVMFWPSRNKDNGYYPVSGVSAAGDNQGTTFSKHYAYDDALSIRIWFDHFANVGGGEIITDLDTLTVQTALAQTFGATPIQALFGGNPSITKTAVAGLPPFGTDDIPISGPIKGTHLFVNTFAQWPVGKRVGATGLQRLPTSPVGTFPAGLIETHEIGNNYVGNNSIPAKADGSNQLLTAGNAWLSAFNCVGFAPTFLTAKMLNMNRQVLGIVGDSVPSGTKDQARDTGYIQRACLNYGIGLMRLCRGNESAFNWAGTLRAIRYQELMATTGVIFDHGRNDLNGGRTLAQLQADVINEWKDALAIGLPAFQTTCTPFVTGTYATIAGQVVDATKNAVKQAFNAWVRDLCPMNSSTQAAVAVGATGAGIVRAGLATGHMLRGIIDTASMVETDANNTVPGGPGAPLTGGYWYCPAGVQWSDDGLHPNNLGHQAITPRISEVLPFI